jgi:hypothetical protein
MSCEKYPGFLERDDELLMRRERQRPRALVGQGLFKSRSYKETRLLVFGAAFASEGYLTASSSGGAAAT